MRNVMKFIFFNITNVEEVSKAFKECMNQNSFSLFVWHYALSEAELKACYATIRVNLVDPTVHLLDLSLLTISQKKLKFQLKYEGAKPRVYETGAYAVMWVSRLQKQIHYISQTFQ